jgi:hypothetical protein
MTRSSFGEPHRGPAVLVGGSVVDPQLEGVPSAELG